MLSLQSVLEASGLDLTGWTLSHAQGVSDDGMLGVGRGENPSGDEEAWIATLPDPPAVPALDAVGVGALVLLLTCVGALVAPRARAGGASSLRWKQA